MNASNDRAVRWKAFRDRWPNESLSTLTLGEYSQVNQRACLSGWLKSEMTRGLGWRPRRGSSLDRIGVCVLRPNQDGDFDKHDDNPNRPRMRVDIGRGYCWHASLGDDLDSAFQAVLHRLVQIAECAKRGDTSVLKEPVLHPDYEWKLFFLYQDMDHPVLLPAQDAEQLSDWFWQKFKKPMTTARRPSPESALAGNQRLMDARGGLPFFDYVDQLAVEASEEDMDAVESDSTEGLAQEELAPLVDKQSQPLNQILFGPPGTGKTFGTIDAALSILDPAFLNLHAGDEKEQRRALKSRFDRLVQEQRIRFVTFHQSFSYEDFVEGLRAHSQNGQLQYRVDAGVFRQLCDDARTAPGERSLNDHLDDLLEELSEQGLPLTTPTGKAFTASYTPVNDTIACLPDRSTTGKPLPANIDHVRAVMQGHAVSKIYCESYVRGIANHVRERAKLNQVSGVTPAKSKRPFVLIIDEINRGNISRIFGELITLIEPSKRQGADESLQVVLPYSKLPFSVPDNVYLIGTMNTADRSLTGMDVALRRRFVFKAMPPQPEKLSQLQVQGVPIAKLLEVMNQRIEALLDRDHCLGHAYFMPLKDEPTLAKLAGIFRNQVLPLLQEYFFDDWQRIQWVLNDHRKPEEFRFVCSRTADVAELFGKDVNVSGKPQAWWVNGDAFHQVESYLGVIELRSAVAQD